MTPSIFEPPDENLQELLRSEEGSRCSHFECEVVSLDEGVTGHVAGEWDS